MKFLYKFQIDRKRNELARVPTWNCFGRTEPQTDGVERLLDLLLPMAIQVKKTRMLRVAICPPPPQKKLNCKNQESPITPVKFVETKWQYNMINYIMVTNNPTNFE